MSGNIRPRKVCANPDCRSLTIHRRVTIGDYKCRICGWTGVPGLRVVAHTAGNVSSLERKLTKPERLEKIRKTHELNPGYSQRQLIAFVPETRHMVHEYFKTLK